MINVKTEESKGSARNSILWLLIVVLLGAGIWAYYYFGQIAWSLRAAAALVLICVLAGIASQTTQGERLWGFAKSARTELRKVVWPTRQETVQTTLLIIAMVIVMALLLWGVDTVLMWAVSWLSGQRG